MRTPAELSAAAEVRLQQIQAITDVAFAHMDDEALLGEMLERVREIMRVDTAVVLLLDDSRRRLVATAARGIEEEVRQSVQVSVGKGFAGRVAAERRPVIIENVDAANVVNPLLVQRGVRSLLGTPLLVGGDLLGVLHVGTLTTRRFIAEDVEFLQLAADRAAMAAHSLRTAAERSAVRELQRSLVPSELPSIPGVDMAARYSPGTSVVGGDWYDVFTLPSGELGVVMGDVAGQGLRAAVIMGRMRSVLRAYAMESDDPALVLDKLDRKMQHFEPGVMATVLYAVCDPRLRWARIASAGHWPPVLAAPGSVGALLEVAPGLLIGLDEYPRRRSTTVEIPPEAVLCLYTDGLIERRDTTIETNLARLCDAVRPGPPDAVCATVMAELVGREAVPDDVALLALRRTP
ncbi:GAF domain-containing SpoIIE family protein phosphatase [Actinomadura sp. DC4]|uniref:PP2C family protein-serine/threonine phosphatase n=1 Tax=Actinomadura sp. DC4 TaxID=3055069 RepID=UPI0025B13B4B|nr:GAF domain-containing SpoIIE family protein phosphatase [Actinomadura sp. DC4]MDN3353616.1 SpoIIE family protein phosphatase [Actinomadura sp. DC4]